MIKEKRILVPLDFSPGTPDVLKAAERLAEEENCGLVLLHVIEPFDAMRQRPPVILNDILEDYAHLVHRIPPERVRVISLEGTAVEAILDAAIACRCHLIVMGKGGRGQQAGHVAAGVHSRVGHKTRLIPTKKLGGVPC